MKPFGNKSATNKCGFFVFLWYQVICFLVMTAFIPFLLEPPTFAVGHNLDNIVDKSVQGGVKEKKFRMIMVSDLGNNVFNGFFDNRPLPIVFGVAKKENSAPIGKTPCQESEDNVMIEFHLALLSILIGCIVGDYCGRLYGLRYRSNRY